MSLAENDIVLPLIMLVLCGFSEPHFSIYGRQKDKQAKMIMRGKQKRLYAPGGFVLGVLLTGTVWVCVAGRPDADGTGWQNRAIPRSVRREGFF